MPAAGLFRLTYLFDKTYSHLGGISATGGRAVLVCPVQCTLIARHGFVLGRDIHVTMYTTISEIECVTSSSLQEVTFFHFVMSISGGTYGPAHVCHAL